MFNMDSIGWLMQLLHGILLISQALPSENLFAIVKVWLHFNDVNKINGNEKFCPETIYNEFISRKNISITLNYLIVMYRTNKT